MYIGLSVCTLFLKIKSMRKNIFAAIICSGVVMLSLVTYVHVIAPKPDDYKQYNENFVFEQTVNGVDMTFSYINKQKKEVSMEPKWIGYKRNLKVPAEVTHNETLYKVIELSKDYSINCDTLFIPETIVYIDRSIPWERCRINYVSVDPNNKFYKSIDGNLYKGDSLLYDRNAKREE